MEQDSYRLLASPASCAQALQTLGTTLCLQVAVVSTREGQGQDCARLQLVLELEVSLSVKR